VKDIIMQMEKPMKLIFKYSPVCPVSNEAETEIRILKKAVPEGLEFESVNVIENRRRSDEIVEEYGIRHESPQVILVDEHNVPVFDASHFDISAEIISSYISEDR
jgi:bacillithiol system protein YtxJ